VKRNGFYVAASLRVGNVFNDWDEVTCLIITKTEKESHDDSVKEMNKKK
jgi:hypothetical protein